MRPSPLLASLLKAVRALCDQQPGLRAALARETKWSAGEVSTYLSEHPKRRPNGEKALMLRDWLEARARPAAAPRTSGSKPHPRAAYAALLAKK